MRKCLGTCGRKHENVCALANVRACVRAYVSIHACIGDCACMRNHVGLCMLASIRTCVCLRELACMCAYLRGRAACTTMKDCVCVPAHMCMHSFTCASARAYTPACACMRICSCGPACAFIRACAFVHAFACMYTFCFVVSWWKQRYNSMWMWKIMSIISWEWVNMRL